jgi:hypothetical protein
MPFNRADYFVRRFDEKGDDIVPRMCAQKTGVLEKVIVNNTLSDMSTLDPTWNSGATGFWSYINVGRNEPDGWTTFNGNIGDVFVYKTALSASELDQLEGLLLPRYGIVLHTITATAEANGSISPSGATPVVAGEDRTFTFIPDFGYAVNVVTVDGTPQPGHPTSYTFTNVVGPHTISVSFTELDPFNDWIGFFFPTPGDPAAAKNADPDGDGIINLAEFAFDDDPTSGEASGKMRSRIEADGGEQALMLTLPVIDGAFFGGMASLSATIDGVLYTIEGSNDLATFDQVVTEVIPARDAGMDPPNFGWGYRTFRLSGAVGGGTPRGPKGFLRARVEEVP